MTDAAQIAKVLTPAQRNRLKRYTCALCDQDCYSALKGQCSAMYGKCEHVTSIHRAADCLECARFEHIRAGTAKLRAVAAELEARHGGTDK